MKRLSVLKTYKMYCGGEFIRSESGRYFTPKGKEGAALGNVCLASRKDFRNAVTAARGALAGWAGRTAYNRGQILYRIGEMLEGRSAQFVDELMEQGISAELAREETAEAVDRCVYYAGWCDKYQQIFSCVNPVASAYFNFSVCEPMGVVAAIAPEGSALLGFLGTLLPVIAGANACVILASPSRPLPAVTLAEVLATSDLPGGVVNVLTGNREELLPVMMSHMDVNAVVASDLTEEQWQLAREESIHNLKRVVRQEEDPATLASPYAILATQEIKTTWHPVEAGIGGGGKY